MRSGQEADVVAIIHAMTKDYGSNFKSQITTDILKQNFNTSDMAHKIPRCIEWVSATHTLEPGDVLATGTNHRGLGAFQHGDKVELEVQGLGRLAITVADALGRAWEKQTRLERTSAGLAPDVAPQLSGKYAKG